MVGREQTPESCHSEMKKEKRKQGREVMGHSEEVENYFHDNHGGLGRTRRVSSKILLPPRLLLDIPQNGHRRPGNPEIV